MDEQRNINKEKSAQQQETISSLSTDLQHMESDVKNELHKKEISNNILVNILMGIQDLFLESRCDALSVLHLLGMSYLLNVVYKSFEFTTEEL